MQINPTAPGPVMPIGRFARACRLSIKALRHYDEEGLLVPAVVDERTGYRYYARAQVRDAILIGLLRELGIGLAAIRRILNEPVHARELILRTEAQRIERELAQRRRALQTIERFVASGTLAPYEITIRKVEPLQVAHRTAITTTEHLVADTTTLIYSLFDELRSVGRKILPPVLCMNDDRSSDEHILVHACARLDAPFPALSSAGVMCLPGGDFAVVTHHGAYEELGLAYHALYAWAQEYGHEGRGLIREIYLNDPADVPPEDLRTEVLMPLDV
jgi:DNA-binding transcriptional MerR regulator